MSQPMASSYKAAGVDLEAAEALVDRLKPLAARTRTPGVESSLGSFGGFFSFPEPGGKQLLVASIDGVGTKMKVAKLTGQWEGAGYDIVAHCTDDILVHGAKPLFFLDYIGTSKLDLQVLESLGRGMAEACVEARCALLGGETAEMPGVYLEGEVDLVGCMIGSVERDCLLTGDQVRAGDQLLGLASLGLHTNGYSLARHILVDNGPGIDAPIPGTQTRIGDALAARHRMYLGAVRERLSRAPLHAMAHITGGGIPGNLSRVLPRGLGAVVHKDRWAVPPLFRLIQETGKVSEDEMYRVFNMGIGWMLVVEADAAQAWQRALEDEGWGAGIIGEIEEGADGVRLVG
ncbi:MAG: phosphoribosylformylglycinamidine cyclo-ligase [Candidatus Eisenbacteria sp.]|nr:phosphoribosylformylglycinamidine cyclo-ligase [Candidatus Eisenbacteria bacterium]